MPQDLAERISSLSPGALRLFKQQIATLPEASRQTAFSKLSGIPELADITGQPATPTAQLGAPTPQPQVQQAEQQEVPFWMKALQTVAKPIEWLQEHVATPFAAGFQAELREPGIQPTDLPGLLLGPLGNLAMYQPGTQAREKYEAWQAPTLETGMTWPKLGPVGGGPVDISTKHISELAPWLAVPSAAGIQATLRGGGKAAQLGAKALTPAVKAEQVLTYPITKTLGMLGTKTPRMIWKQLGEPGRVALSRSAGLSEATASKTWAGMATTERKAISNRIQKPTMEVAPPPAEAGMAMPLATQQEMLARAGTGQPGFSTERMGLVYRNPQGKPIAVATLHPEPSGAIRVGSVVADEKSLLKGRAAKAILDELEKTPNVVLPPASEMSPMGLKIAEKYQRGLVKKAGLEAPPTPIILENIIEAAYQVRQLPVPFRGTEQEITQHLQREITKRLGTDPTITLYRGSRARGTPLLKPLIELKPKEVGAFWTSDIKIAKQYGENVYKVDVKASELADSKLVTLVGGTEKEFHLVSSIQHKATPITPELVGIGKPPVKPPTATMAVPGGFTPPQGAAIAKLTQLVKGTKPITKETLALRKPEQAIRVGEYEKLLQQHRVQGVPVEEADRLATQALAGRYPQAEITAELDVIRKGMTQDEVHTLFNIIGDAQYASSFTRRNTIQALQDLFLTNRLQQNQIRLLEETFGPKLARELLKKRPRGEKVRELIIDIANAPRSLLASCDISGLLRQGAILFARRPIEGVQTVKPMLQAMFMDKNAVMIDSIIRARPFMEQAMRPGLKVPLELTSLPSREVAMLTQFEEAFASKIMNKIPFVRASNRAFVTVLNDMRSRSVTSTLRNWNKSGLRLNEKLDYWRPGSKEYGLGDISDLNQLVNWASGRGTLPKALQNQGKLLNALIFAPKFQLAHLQFPTAILPRVTKSALVRREAWREILSFVGAGAGILTMAKLSGASDIELNPRSADFGKMRVGETRLDIWAGYAQYMRFAANLATGQKKSVGGRTYSVSRKDVIDRFVRTKFSPAMGLLNDLLMGETYMGEDLPPKSAKSAWGQLYERTAPMAIQGMVDAYSQEGPIGILIGSAELLGIGAVTYTNEVKKEQEKVAKAQYGMSWEEVGKQYGRATQLRLEQTTPAIQEAEKEEEKRFATGSPTITGQWHNEGQSIEDTYREIIDQAVREYRQTRNGVVFREKVNDAAKYRRVSYGARAKREEYQDIVSYYNQPLEPDKIAQMNPSDVLRREYYQQVFAADMYDEFGNYRFEEAELREQEFMKKHGQQALDYIEDYRGSVWLDKPTELKTFEYAKEILRPYWKIADAIWSMYSPQLKDLSDQIIILERTDPIMARRALKSYPQILRARELIAQYRKMARERNPRINQAYRMYYSY